MDNQNYTVEVYISSCGDENEKQEAAMIQNEFLLTFNQSCSPFTLSYIICYLYF